MDGTRATAIPDGFWRSDGPAARGTLAAVGVLALLFLAANLTRDFQVGDEGVALVDAERIARGQVPHADFFEIVPPGSFLPTALAFKLLGPTVLAGRLPLLFYGLLLIAGVDLLLRRLTENRWLRAAAALFLIPCGVNYWLVPSHHWAVDVAQLFALAALARGLDGEHPLLWGALSGALMAAGFFCLQDQGAYLVAGTGALVLPWVPERPRRWRLCAGWAAGGLLVAGGFALWLLPRVSPAELWYQWALFPASRYKGIPGNQGGLLKGWATVWGSYGWRGLKASPVYASSALALNGALTLLPLGAAAGLAWTALGRKVPRPQALALAVGALAFAGGCAHRWSLVNLAWAAPGLLVPAAGALGWALASDRRALRAAARGLAGVVALSSAAWVGAHAAGVARGPVARAVTPAGAYWSRGVEEARALESEVAAVAARVPEGKPLFCRGFVPLFNFLTRRPPPSRFNYLGYPAYHTESQRNEVVSLLERTPECRVLAVLPLEKGNAFDDFLLAHYRPLWNDGRVVLLGRVVQEPEVPDAAEGRVGT